MIKRCKGLLMMLGLSIIQLYCLAQSKGSLIGFENLDPYPIEIGYNKTTNLIFPYSIISVDKGSAAVLAQKAKGVDNVLQIKAAVEAFAQTNLTVITKDGKLYSFLLDYSNNPLLLNIQLVADSMHKAPNAVLAGTFMDELTLKKISGDVLRQEPFLHIYNRDQKIKLSLDGIYIHENVMWFSLNVSNSSLIDYKPENVRFYVKDLQRVKRTAMQEIEIHPLFIKMDSVINGNTSSKIVFGFKPFTIPTTQYLTVEMAEREGGRSIRVRSRSSALLKARELK